MRVYVALAALVVSLGLTSAFQVGVSVCALFQCGAVSLCNATCLPLRSINLTDMPSTSTYLPRHSPAPFA